MKWLISKKDQAIALLLAFVTMLAFSTVHAAADAAGFDASTVTSAIDGIGLPAMIGAAAAAMLGIVILIWGVRKIINFFSRG